MSQHPETIDGLPNLCGSEREIENAIRKTCFPEDLDQMMADNAGQCRRLEDNRIAADYGR